MAGFSPKRLFSLWKKEDVTAEQAIGYLIQNQVKQEERFRQLLHLIGEVRTLLEKFLVLMNDDDFDQPGRTVPQKRR